MALNYRQPNSVCVFLLLCNIAIMISSRISHGEDRFHLKFEALPDVPDQLGVAGPFVGVHGDALIVAGGANFPRPVWENEKVWRDSIFVLTKDAGEWTWTEAGKLPRPLGYGAAVSPPQGVLCMGGNDSENTYTGAFLMTWNSQEKRIEFTDYPSLPAPCAYGQATVIGETVYLAGGQSAAGLETAMKNFWTYDLKQGSQGNWQKTTPWPGPARAFNLTVAQHNGSSNCVYVMSGRTQKGDSVSFLRDVWEYNPQTDQWRERAQLPRSVMAGTAVAHGTDRIFILGGADGSLFTKAEELKDAHPGFPREALQLNTVNDIWSSAGEIPLNHVTTIPVHWGNTVILPTGEIRPRVRTPKVWSISID